MRQARLRGCDWLNVTPVNLPSSEASPTAPESSHKKLSPQILNCTRSVSPTHPAHLQRFPLQLIDNPPDLAQEEGPGVYEVNAVHHDGDDAVPALEAPGQAVLDEEGVAEDEPVLLVPEEDGAFTARTHLAGEGERMKKLVYEAWRESVGCTWRRSPVRSPASPDQVGGDGKGLYLGQRLPVRADNTDFDRPKA